MEARQLRDSLKLLLRKEQAAMADFLIALADFDRRRGWETLGHASLFAFLRIEFGLSTAATFWRMSAARLLQRFPEVTEPIRDGRLCLTTTTELAKVLNEENRTVLLPRFYGSSARDAKELVAELQPRPAPPLHALVTPAFAAVPRPEPVPPLAPAGSAKPLAPEAPARRLDLRVDPQSHTAPRDTYPESLRAPEIEMTHPARVAAHRDEVEPLTADLRRLHVTVTRQFLKKLDAARDGLSHAMPGATTEQVLEAALDLLLEKQAKARGQVMRPRARLPTASLANEGSSAPDSPAQEAQPLALVPTEPPPHRRTGPRETIPAAVRRAVWERDGGRCAWPLDSGGRCGSTHRIELDHLLPWARGGTPTVEGLRLLCHRHNSLAANQVFGARCMGRYSAGARPTGRDQAGNGAG